MGFNSVYQTLKELFPQVDTRLLKAVAIEHAKDPDVAVESILTEVLPFICEKSSVDNSVVRNKGKMVETPLNSVIVASVCGKDDNGSHMLNEAHNIDGDSLASSFYDANDTDDLQSGNIRNEDSSFARCEETIIGACQAEKLSVISGSLINKGSNDDCTLTFEDHEGETFVPCDYQDRGTDVHANRTADASLTMNNEYSEVDVRLGDPGNVNHWISADQAPLSVTELEAETGASFSDADNKETNTCVDADLTQECPVIDGGGANAETALSTIITNSGQICRINLVEDIIEDAKNYKVALFTATESVLRLMEDVELHEKEAEIAKAAAARGGLDILEKVEEIKKMLKHAKEANEMHAGEVYGEKSILATEVRELQTRLLGLADEKDKSLAILDMMRKSLEARLAVSEEERKAAEKEMLEKQEIARVALVEQELIMDKVVQESKMLQQEAEENAKLRDFLMEKGRVVDELQGEISVICQDVKSLKEKFDKRVSLSKSLSIEQTSFRMASSTSSVKSIASDPATGHMELLETLTRMSPAPSVECQSPKSNVGDDVVVSAATPHREQLDDGWELFDFL